MFKNRKSLVSITSMGLLSYLHQKIMQKKFLKKRNFLGQAHDFLPPRKPGLYISRVDFFSLNIRNWLSKMFKIRY